MCSRLEHCRENYPYVVAQLIVTRQRFYSSALELYVYKCKPNEGLLCASIHQLKGYYV